MKVACYCRTSTRDQSCDRQVRDLKDFADRRGDDIIGIYIEVASGAKNDRAERKKVMALAQARRIDAILVTELTRWGRSTIDLITTLQELQSFEVSVIAQTGLQFDLSTPQGKLISGLMAVLAEFERELTVERVRSGLAAAKARGVKLGRPEGFRPTADKYGEQVMAMVGEGKSYRVIAGALGISKNSVMGIVQRYRVVD